jgi:hypothetical protein
VEFVVNAHVGVTIVLEQVVLPLYCALAEVIILMIKEEVLLQGI